MSGTSKNDDGIAALQEDVAALKRDVTRLIEHLKSGAAAGTQSAAEQLAAEVERSANAIGRQVEEQPLVALLIALGVGYVFGRLLSR